MARHDILVYDDDESLRGNLSTRRLLVEAALQMLTNLAGDSDPVRELALRARVIGFDTREGLLQAIETRRKSDWAIALIDLEDADGSMRGARIIRTIREHAELRARCMPAALTVHANLAMEQALEPWAFALIAIRSTTASERICAALRELYARNPTEKSPGCAAFPEAEELAATPAFRELVHRALGIDPWLGDDVVIRHIARGIPNTVTDSRLAALASASNGAPWRRTVDEFKQAVAKATGWDSATTDLRVRAMFSRMPRWEAEDPLHPKEIKTAASVWADPAGRQLARIPVAKWQAVNGFFEVFEERLRVSPGSTQNAALHERASIEARAETVRRHGVLPDWIDHTLHVLLDVHPEENQ